MSDFTDNSSYQDPNRIGSTVTGENSTSPENGGSGADQTEGSEKETLKASIMEWARDIAIALILALCISMLIKPTIVKESSMEPNFNENDYIFLSRIAYKFGGEPNRGDVIVFRTSSENLLDAKGKHKLLIKRIIGLPGDRIRIADGEVYVNGEADDQSYTKDGETWLEDRGDGEVLEITVPEGELFCMGDNREVSIDSRSEDVGCVDEETIVGKAVFRLFPLSEAGVIHNVYE